MQDVGCRRVLKVTATPPNTYEASRVKRKYFPSKPAGWPTLKFLKTLLPDLVSHWLVWAAAVPHKCFHLMPLRFAAQVKHAVRQREQCVAYLQEVEI